MLFNMSIASTLLAHKQIFAIIAVVTIVAVYMIPFDAISEVFAARGGSGGGGCFPYCHVKP
jgi:hypothetical protein